MSCKPLFAQMNVTCTGHYFLIFDFQQNRWNRLKSGLPKIINNCMIPSLYSLNLQPKYRLKFKRIWKLLSLPRSYANARLGGDKMKKYVTHVLILRDIFWIYFIPSVQIVGHRCNGEILSITFSKETRNLKWSMINQVEFARVMDDDGATKLQIRSVTSLQCASTQTTIIPVLGMAVIVSLSAKNFVRFLEWKPCHVW